MTGYVRNDTGNNIADGNVIAASDLDGEFDSLVAAFNNSTGHTHDGTSAEGAPITKVGPVQDLQITASALLPKSDNTLDLGSSSFEFKDLYIDGTANIDSLVADTADINGGTIDGATITSPRIVTGINDSNGNELFKLTATGSAVNEFTVANAATGSSPSISATGGDTNININFIPKGTGTLQSNGTNVLLNGGALGTPSSGTLTNATGLPISTGVSGLGSNMATFLATPSSSNLAATVTDETGSGALVFATSPTLTTPNLGTPSAGTLTNCSGLPVSTGVSGLGTGVATFLGTPNSSNLKAAVTDETGSGALVFATSPTLTTPNLGTPSAATLTNATGLPIDGGTTGTLPVARGGTGVTSSTGTGSVVLSASPTFTGTVSAAGINISSFIDLADNDILRFGTSDDMEIYHNGTANYIDLNVGDMIVRDNTTTRFTFGRTSGDLTITGTFVGGGVSTIPQDARNANYTLVAGDAGQHIYKSNTSAYTWTIPANASVAFATGTVVTFVNGGSAGNITIAITSDTMRLAGAGTTGSRTLAAYGVATAIKVASTTWIISGVGLT